MISTIAILLHLDLVLADEAVRLHELIAELFLDRIHERRVHGSGTGPFGFGGAAGAAPAGFGGGGGGGGFGAAAFGSPGGGGVAGLGGGVGVGPAAGFSDCSCGFSFSSATTYDSGRKQVWSVTKTWDSTISISGCQRQTDRAIP